MGLLGSIFGGSSTTQSTKTTVETTTNVGIENKIDTQAFADALNRIAQIFQQGQDDQEQLTKTQQALTLLNTAVEADKNQIEQQRNDQIAGAAKTFRLAALGGLGLAGIYLFLRK